MGEGEVSVAEQVRRYIDARPVVREALARELVNLSELTRRILDDTGIRQEHAVLAACRRYREQLGEPVLAGSVREGLAGCTLEIRTRVSALTVEHGGRPRLPTMEITDDGAGRVHVLADDDSTTIIGDQALLTDLRSEIEPDVTVTEHVDVAAIHIGVPDTERKAAILGLVASALAQERVACLEATSQRQGVTFVVDRGRLTELVEAVELVLGATHRDNA